MATSSWRRLTIADGGGRDNVATAKLIAGYVEFDALKLCATWNGRYSAPRIMIDDLRLRAFRAERHPLLPIAVMSAERSGVFFRRVPGEARIKAGIVVVIFIFETSDNQPDGAKLSHELVPSSALGGVAIQRVRHVLLMAALGPHRRHQWHCRQPAVRSRRIVDGGLPSAGPWNSRSPRCWRGWCEASQLGPPPGFIAVDGQSDRPAGGSSEPGSAAAAPKWPRGLQHRPAVAPRSLLATVVFMVFGAGLIASDPAYFRAHRVARPGLALLAEALYSVPD